MGKETGYCRGRGGSMHIADVERNNLGANGIVAGGIPMSVGVGLSIKLRGTDQVCLVIFGDGASNTGPFHEALNMASIWDLPVIFLCENNQYAMSMSVPRAFNIEHISQRASAYGIPGVTVDGNDYLAVYDAISTAAQRAREGKGPTLVEAITYRWRGHSRATGGCTLRRTRSSGKPGSIRALLTSCARWFLSDDQLRSLRQRKPCIADALTFAEARPEPVQPIMEVFMLTKTQAVAGGAAATAVTQRPARGDAPGDAV
jgi:pyruvate dehydrogenase E1 component alpha subunit